jgi:hypothetical protein
VLLVEHPSYPHGRFTGDTPPAGGEDTGLVLSLAHAASVAGKIEGFPGDREHVRVSAMLRDPGAGSESVMADMMEDAGFGADGLESAVAPDGAFKIDGLEAGRAYSIRAYARGGFFGRDACSDERVVVAGAGDAKLTWKPGGELAFRVVDAATRNPLDGVEVRFRWERDGGNGFPDGTRTRKFAEGQVLLDDLRPKGGQTTLSMIVCAPGYLELRRDGVAVSGEERVDLGTIELQPAATLRVSVVDGEDKPVSAAKVRLVPLKADGEEEEGDNGLFSLKSRTSSGKTDSEGVCELAAVTTPLARLEVTHPRFCDFTAEPVQMPTQGVGEQFARLIEGGRVVVLVVDALGQPVADVQVDHRYPAGSPVESSDHSTNKRGEVRLKNQAPGEHKFRTQEQGAEIGEGDEREQAWQDVQVLDGKEARVTLEVAARATLEGVITQAGAPLDRATVSLLKPEAGESEEIVIEFQAQLGRYTPDGFDSTDRTDRKGSYKLEDVPAGKYRLGVSHPDRALPHVVQVDVHNGENHLDIDLPITAIEGRVTDSDGRPLPGARVRVSPAPKEGTGDEIESGRDAMSEYFGGGEGGVKTDADGRYRVVGVPADKAVVVRASEAEHVAGKSKEVTLATGEVRERVDLQLAPGGILRVRVLTETGPFTFLQATYAGEGGVAPRMAPVRRGEAVFRGLKPGPWKVTRAGDDDDGEEQADEKSASANVTASSETLVDFAP